MNASEMNHYSRAANIVSFIITAFLALVSVFHKHFEMPVPFKVAIIVMILVSAYLLRYTLVSLDDKGCRGMVYTLVFHGALFAVTVIGAKMGAYK